MSGRADHDGRLCAASAPVLGRCGRLAPRHRDESPSAAHKSWSCGSRLCRHKYLVPRRLQVQQGARRMCMATRHAPHARTHARTHALRPSVADPWPLAVRPCMCGTTACSRSLTTRTAHPHNPTTYASACLRPRPPSLFSLSTHLLLPTHTPLVPAPRSHTHPVTPYAGQSVSCPPSTPCSPTLRRPLPPSLVVDSVSPDPPSKSTLGSATSPTCYTRHRLSPDLLPPPSYFRPSDTLPRAVPLVRRAAACRRCDLPSLPTITPAWLGSPCLLSDKAQANLDHRRRAPAPAA